jgi:hypothetical protein
MENVDEVVNIVDEDDSDDFGDPKSWDPHAGLKPSEVDNYASDGDLEPESVDALPYDADNEVNGAMVDMMVDNDEWDTRDLEWLPLSARRKLPVTVRKKGKNNFVSRMRK